MANDRDDKFEGQEESEYHFSDEEISYEVEPEHEAAKQPAESGEGGGGGAKESIITRLTQSKRMLIILGIFLVLVGVVYKIVAPSSTPSTDISAAPVVAAQQNAMPAVNTQQNAAVAQNQASPAAAAQTQAVAAPSTQVPVTAQTSQAAQPVQSAAGTNFQNLPPSALQAAPATGSAQLAQPQNTALSQGLQQASGGLAQQLQQNVPVVANLPSVIPVQSSGTQAGYNAQTAPTGMPSSIPSGTGIDAKTAMLSSQSEQLMNQLQNQYSQQVNDFDSKNKALQDQLQSLSARVAVMENQLNQLVQVLTRRTQGSSMANPVAPSQEAPKAPDVKIAYNVQAIIPGRAWLKSDNGETLTVAEGDMIKDVGRVTKIDPYDGVVEINTGSKAVSLSYGSGG